MSVRFHFRPAVLALHRVRITCPTEDVAREIAKLKLFTVDTFGKVTRAQLYHHSRDAPPDAFGHVANIAQLVRGLSERYGLVGDPTVLIHWTDGFSCTAGAFVESRVRVAVDCSITPQHRVYSVRGKEGKAPALAIVGSLLAHHVNSRGVYVVSADHSALGKIVCIPPGGGRHGMTHPVLQLPARNFPFQFFGQLRGVPHLVRSFIRLMDTLGDLAKLHDGDVPLKILRDVYKLAKQTRANGVVGPPDMVKFSSHDPCSDPRRARQIRLLNQATGRKFKLENSVMLNGYAELALQADGCLDLGWMMQGAPFRVHDEQGAVVLFHNGRSVQPVEPGQLVFVQHQLPFDQQRVVVVAPLLHAQLWLSALVLQMLEKSMDLHGVVAGQDTTGWSAKERRQLVEQIKSVTLGRGHVGGHTYINASASKSLFRAYIDLFGPVLPRGLLHVPRLALAARAANVRRQVPA